MEQKASENEEKEEHEPSTNRAQNVPPDVPPDVARNSNLYQTPDTRLSFPTGKDKRGRATPPPKPDGIDEQVWRDWLQLEAKNVRNWTEFRNWLYDVMGDANV